MKTELRIGNFINTFINTTNGKLYARGKVEALHMNTVEVEDNVTMQYNMIEPIELNNEWLEKFGFVKYNESFYRIELKRNNIDGWYLSSENELTKSMSEIMVRIKYVHNLQNFWFSLTGKELTFI
ncbi:MAG: hypothetical protein ACOVNU_08660 [Candidatus Kapaibacteriota bacterium]